VPRPAYTNWRRATSRSVTISTGRITAVPSGRTKPWIEHGTPSRNGITRMKSQRGPKKRAALRWSTSSTIQRT
jgi:hypothetical protein